MIVLFTRTDTLNGIVTSLGATLLDASGVAQHLAEMAGINGGGHGHSAVARFTREQFAEFMETLKKTG